MFRKAAQTLMVLSLSLPLIPMVSEASKKEAFVAAKAAKTQFLKGANKVFKNQQGSNFDMGQIKVRTTDVKGNPNLRNVLISLKVNQNSNVVAGVLYYKGQIQRSDAGWQFINLTHYRVEDNRLLNLYNAFWKAVSAAAKK